LERELGVRLLNRTTRGVAPTGAGEALLARLAPVLRDLDEALDAVADARGNPSGTLRINANESPVSNSDCCRLHTESILPRRERIRFPRDRFLMDI
jgi:DNA-binding transcriptional LysR family regulator